ncbi:MAG: hypothetical protein JWR69_393 [Pedosphaera sp.]|nr:hypothetical protein [Pedosphaera sp.]
MGGDEGFLGDILALAEMAEPAVGEGTNQHLIAGDGVAEGVAFPGQGAGDEFGVVFSTAVIVVSVILY